MKKIFFIMLILTITISMTACNNNPYIGQYISSDNTILKLDSNDSCTIIRNLYKEAFYSKGKYVIKDNNIVITFDKNDSNYYGISSLKGKFEGSRIELYNSSDNEHYIYDKE